MLSEMSLVNVGSLLLIAFHQPLFGHNLQELQDGCVASGSVFVEGFLHLANSAGTPLPEHSQDREFGVGWPLLPALSHRFFPQWRHPTTKDFVVSTKIFVEGSRG